VGIPNRKDFLPRENAKNTKKLKEKTMRYKNGRAVKAADKAQVKARTRQSLLTVGDDVRRL